MKLKPDTGEESPREYYDLLYEKQIQQRTVREWQSHGSKALNYAAILLAEPPILELGCGAGQLAAQLRAFGLGDRYWLGIDYSPTAIRIAHMNAPGARFLVGDIRSHPAALSPDYNTAVLIEVLEHVKDDVEVLERIPSGKLVVASVPSSMTTGHVRSFRWRFDVEARYSQVLKIDRIVEDRGMHSTNMWWIFRGHRR